MDNNGVTDGPFETVEEARQAIRDNLQADYYYRDNCKIIREIESCDNWIQQAQAERNVRLSELLGQDIDKADTHIYHKIIELFPGDMEFTKAEEFVLENREDTVTGLIPLYINENLYITVRDKEGGVADYSLADDELTSVDLLNVLRIIENRLNPTP